MRFSGTPTTVGAVASRAVAARSAGSSLGTPKNLRLCVRAHRERLIAKAMAVLTVAVVGDYIST